MSRIIMDKVVNLLSPPRASGDEPLIANPSVFGLWSAPRERG